MGRGGPPDRPRGPRTAPSSTASATSAAPAGRPARSSATATRSPIHSGFTSSPFAFLNVVRLGGSSGGGAVPNPAAVLVGTTVIHGYQYRTAGSAKAARSGSRTAFDPAKN